MDFWFGSELIDMLLMGRSNGTGKLLPRIKNETRKLLSI